MERKKVKYTFEEEEQSRLDAVWEGNEDLQQTADRLFIAHKAKGTMEQYNPVQKEFKEFCDTTAGLSYQIMGEKEVRLFITHCANVQKGAAYWMKFKPSLEQLQVCRNRPAAQTAFTAYNNALIAGAKREANLRKGITKKKDALEVEALKKGLIQEVWKYCPDRIQEINLVKIRTLFRWTVCRETISRFEDFGELQAKHFSKSKDNTAIQVFFPKMKNDQRRNGNTKFLPKKLGEGKIICPYTLTLVYFARCGFRMSPDDDNYVSCNTRYTKDGQVPVGTVKLQYNNAAQQSKKLLEELGFDNTLYGETSAKRAGVTEALNNDVPLDVIQQVGGWKTQDMALRYAQNDEQYQIRLARRMNLE
jgi:hypothetical protein